MSELAIQAENIGKLYRLGEIGTGTLSHDLSRWAARVRGKEDPFAKIGQVNDRAVKGTNDYVWSLKNINFEVWPGEVLGIIGRNGAGKSTLLKLLSKVTTPTTGEIKVNGRIASLLEVGTGFHPELTGRENIFLNGAILGMTKVEIKQKFDEIVAFSGVERYIDTPVKRYSSGMYVRLAFAVAAHLESEILIIDEVLAVGDAEFQKKCLNKMGDVSKANGKTILFVSHNMGAVKQLCSRLLLLKHGQVVYNGDVGKGIATYMDDMNVNSNAEVTFEGQENEAYIKSLTIRDDVGYVANSFAYNEDFSIDIDFVVNDDIENAEVSICLKNSSSVNVFFTSLSEKFEHNLLSIKKGHYRCRVKVEGNFLIPDLYYISAYIHFRNNRNIDSYEDILKITIVETGSPMAPYGAAATQFACVFGKTNWELHETTDIIKSF